MNKNINFVEVIENHHRFRTQPPFLWKIVIFLFLVFMLSVALWISKISVYGYTPNTSLIQFLYKIEPGNLILMCEFFCMTLFLIALFLANRNRWDQKRADAYVLLSNKTLEPEEDLLKKINEIFEVKDEKKQP